MEQARTPEEYWERVRKAFGDLAGGAPGASTRFKYKGHCVFLAEVVTKGWYIYYYIINDPAKVGHQVLLYPMSQRKPLL